MQELTRRGFAAAAVAGAFAAKGKAGRVDRAAETVTLGKTGVKTARLAQGTGFNGGGRSSAHTRLGQKEFTNLVRHSLERGASFMDLADLYGSHPYLRRALDGVSRDKYTILTKIWPRTEYWNNASGGALKEVDRFRKELDSDVLEVCLIHCMLTPEWTSEYKRIRDEMVDLKQKGAIGAVGVSCHNFEALKVAAEDPWTDVILARINNVGKEALMDASVEEVVPVLKSARSRGKGIIGMKIYGAGRIKTPEKMDASMKFVFENNLVDAVTIGMLNTAEVDDTIARMNKSIPA